MSEIHLGISGRRCALGLFLLLSLGVVFVGIQAWSRDRHHGRPRSSPLPGGRAIPASWWAQVQQRIAAEEYNATPQAGLLQAPNRAQGFRTIFTSEGIEVVPRVGAAEWRLRWRTVSWGREGALATVATVPPRAQEARVEYERGPLVEWYENRPEGVEQGFTISGRPRGEGGVRIRGRFKAEGFELQPAANERGLTLRNRVDAAVLTYAGLVARDARGIELPSRLDLRGSDVELVVDDRSARYPVTIDPLLSAPSWTHEGDLANAQYGFSVATAGDVNADGFSDLLVGAPGYDNGALKSLGRAFLYLGAVDGPSVVADWSAQAGFLGGPGAFGESVASAGDVNGDGYSDVMIGAPQISNGPEASEGHVYLWLGGPSGGAGGASGMGANGTAANADWFAQADLHDARLGYSIAFTGDLNGDGYDDVALGAPGYSNGEASEGMVFVWFGAATGLGANGTPANADWSAQGNAANIAFGHSVAGAGDVNADGYADLLVGAPLANFAFLYLGSATGLGAPGTPLNADWSANGTQAGAQLGYSVATAGDVNADGYSDVIIGAPYYDDPTLDEGKAFVWLGGPSDLGANGNPANAAWSYRGGTNAARCGWSVATAGDVDGDGFADVVVGVPGYSGGQDSEGRVVAFRGSGSGLGTLSFWSYQSNQSGAQLGASVATAGDVNGDGFADIAVGAWLFHGDLSDEGQAAVFFGRAYGPETTASWIGEKNVAGARLGERVAAAGDVNGDGYSDVLVAAPYYDGGNADEGRVYLFVGQPTGLALNHSWSAEGNQTSAFLGGGIGAAGDVDNDGYDDVLIGAPLYDSGGMQDNGAVFLWRGGPAGLGVDGTPANASWRQDGTQSGEYLGLSVSGAGDVNGDGFADVVVGGYGWSNGQAGEGHALLFLGASTGLAAAPAWSAEGNQAGMRFGYTVASAGDVNADGFGDVIVGAPEYSGGQASEGRAYVFLGVQGGLAVVAQWTAEGNVAQAYFGHSAASAGDVNGDGYSDVIVGAYGYDGDQVAEGRAFVYHGSAVGVGAAPAWTAESNQSASQFGISVSSAGDVNGDGYSDIVVGAPGYQTGGVSTGSAFIWLGGSSGLGANGSPLNADWNDNGAQLGVQGMSFGDAVACAGDVDGDGFSDVIIGAPYADDGEVDEGAAFVFYGNLGHGMDRAVQQRRHDDASRVGLQNFSSSETAFRIRSLARSAGGRAHVRLEYELRSLGGPFEPGNAGRSPAWSSTGVPGARGSVIALDDYVGLPEGGGVIRWRTRVVTDSPLFPHGPWLSIPGNGRTEGDIRLLNGVLAVGPLAAGELSFALAGPNPFRDRLALCFVLPAPSHVRLEVFDAGGRRVTTLVNGALPAGVHAAAWNGRDDAGHPSPTGIYFARLTAGSVSRTLKTIRVS